VLKIAKDLARDANKLADACTAQVFIHAYKSLIIKDQLNFDDEEHFRKMDKKSMSMGCGCELCRLRYEYTRYKLERHRCYARATNDEYTYQGAMTASADFDRVDELEEKMATIFYEKSIVKERLGYDKSKARTFVPESTPVYRSKIKDLRARGILIPKTLRPHTFSPSPS